MTRKLSITQDLKELEPLFENLPAPANTMISDLLSHPKSAGIIMDRLQEFSSDMSYYDYPLDIEKISWTMTSPSEIVVQYPAKITEEATALNHVLTDTVLYILWSEYTSHFDDGNYPITEDEFMETCHGIMQEHSAD